MAQAWSAAGRNSGSGRGHAVAAQRSPRRRTSGGRPRPRPVKAYARRADDRAGARRRDGLARGAGLSRLDRQLPAREPCRAAGRQPHSRPLRGDQRGQRVNLCRAPDGRHCAAATGGKRAGSCTSTWTAMAAALATNRYCARKAPPQPGSTSGQSAVDDYVSFTGLGHARLRSGGLQMGTFTICRRGFPARKVVLANSGRVRVEKSRDVCTD